MPHWIQPGDCATWYFDPEQLRQQAATERVRFDQMRAYVTFADGREIRADRGIPLS